MPGRFRLRSLRVGILAMGGVALACQGSPIPVRSAQAEASGPARPKLVVQITVDQLRGDLPMRYRDRLGEGGFRYLLERGVHYANAHYRHANTETAVGHATLVTGADPSAHGVVGGRPPPHPGPGAEGPPGRLAAQSAGEHDR
jgi:arylsulfatase A-like enzyme